MAGHDLEWFEEVMCLHRKPVGPFEVTRTFVMARVTSGLSFDATRVTRFDSQVTQRRAA